MPAVNTLPRLRDITADLALEQKTISFVRYLSALHESKWAPSPLGAVETYTRRWPRDIYRDVVEKAATTAGTLSDANWSPIAPVLPLADAFVAYTYAQT